MAGVKGRSGGWRPGAGRKPGSKNPATLQRESVIQDLAATIPALSHDVSAMLTHIERERQMRHHQAEMLPTILRRLTEIEKHLQLRESHYGPGIKTTRLYRNAPPADNAPPANNTPARPQPQPKHSAAEALFRPPDE